MQSRPRYLPRQPTQAQVHHCTRVLSCRSQGTRGTVVSFVVSLPLQLCNFSNTFPLKTFLRQKTEAATHGKSGRCRLGAMPAVAAVLSHAALLFSSLCVLPSREGWRQEQQGKPRISYTQRSQMGGKQRPPESLKMGHPASQRGWSEENSCGCLPGGKRSPRP